MDLSESTLFNRREIHRQNSVFCSVGFRGDKLNQISVYKRMTDAEREVANLLKEMGIKWTYEHPVFVWDENKRPRVWAPDFFLTNFGIYVEVCGSEKFNYDYRKRIFIENGYEVIFLHIYKEPRRWKNHLFRYLRLFINSRNHKLNEIMENEN